MRYGSVVYRYYQSLDEQETARYRLSSNLHLFRHWAASFRIHREYGKSERLVSRRVRYESQQGVLRELSLGSFTTRFGLGTVLGYRGKLLDLSEKLSGENLLYPDQGGFNGISARMRVSAFHIQAVGSYKRDSLHSTATVGGMIGWGSGNFRPAVIFAAICLVFRLLAMTSPLVCMSIP